MIKQIITWACYFVFLVLIFTVVTWVHHYINGKPGLNVLSNGVECVSTQTAITCNWEKYNK